MTIRVEANFACFRRPEFVEDLVSYDVMPPTVARGLLGGIHSNKGDKWIVDRIGVCNPIRFDLIEVPTERGLRRCLALRDVAYLIDARLSAVADQTAGQRHQTLRQAVSAAGTRLHLGVHGKLANVTATSSDAWLTDVSVRGEIDLGWMLYDLNGPRHARARHFRANLVDGVLAFSDPPGSAFFS